MRTDGRTDRQTHMAKLTVAFPNFANAPKNNTAQQTYLPHGLRCNYSTLQPAIDRRKLVVMPTQGYMYGQWLLQSQIIRNVAQ